MKCRNLLGRASGFLWKTTNAVRPTKRAINEHQRLYMYIYARVKLILVIDEQQADEKRKVCLMYSNKTTHIVNRH
jgi:hypothetical protein